MNASDHNDQAGLKELEKKRDSLYKCFDLSISAVGVTALAAIVLTNRIDNADSIVYGILAGAIVIFVSALLVSLFKYRKAFDAVNDEKRILGLPVKEKQASRLFSTPHPSWGEKLAKCVGLSIIGIGIAIIVVAILDRNGHIPFNVHEMYHRHYIEMVALLGFIGMDALKYRLGLSRLTKVVLWASVLFAIITVPLFLLGHQACQWTMMAAFLLCCINLFRVDKEVFFLEQDDEGD